MSSRKYQAAIILFYMCSQAQASSYECIDANGMKTFTNRACSEMGLKQVGSTPTPTKIYAPQMAKLTAQQHKAHEIKPVKAEPKKESKK